MKHPSLLLPALLLILPTPGAADSRTATLYFDGAVLEQELTAVRGLVEIPISPGFKEHTLRIRPLGNSRIVRVDRSVSYPEKPGSDQDALLEQKHRLEDRLKALEVREQIFISSAKSQSGKTPRKTKANPDPLQSLRQGTDFAIAQLESVYTARRRTLLELRKIEEKIAGAQNRSGSGSPHRLRIQVTPATARIALTYSRSGTGWTPRYDIHIDNNKTARFVMHAQAPSGFEGYRLKFVAATLERSGQSLLNGTADYRLAVEHFLTGPPPLGSVSVILRNTTHENFPAGEASLFRNREYLGRALFRGVSSGRTRQISTAE